MDSKAVSATNAGLRSIRHLVLRLLLLASCCLALVEGKSAAPPYSPTTASGSVATLVASKEGEGFAYAAFRPDGKQIATVEWEGVVKIWAVPSGKFVRAMALPLFGFYWPRAVGYSPDGKLLVCAGSNGEKAGCPAEINVWQVNTGKRLFTLNRMDMRHPVPFKFSRDSATLVVGTSWHIEENIHAWCMRTGKEIARFHDHNFTHFSFTGDGRFCIPFDVGVTCHRPDGTTFVRAISIYSAATWKKVGTADNFKSQLAGYAFSKDSKQLRTTHDDGKLRTWALPSGKLLSVEQEPEAVPHMKKFLAVHRPGECLPTSDGRLAVTYQSQAETFDLWDVASDKKVWTGPAPGAEDGCPLSDKILVFSPDSRWLCTAFSQRKAEIWDLHHLKK